MAEEAPNPSVLLFRHVIRERVQALFQRGQRVIDLGCGTGEDAQVLAARGVRVVGIDPWPPAIAEARRTAAARGLGEEACRFEVAHPEEAAGLGPFEGAYSSLGALDHADLRAVGSGLGRALGPGAPVLLTLLGPRPLPAMVRRALTGEGVRRRERVFQGAANPGVPGAPACLTVQEAERALGPALEWTAVRALGVLVPAAEHHRWVTEHPQAFGVLAALERGVRAWPGLRELGDHVVLEGRRR